MAEREGEDALPPGFFGRRKAKALRAGQAHLYDTLLPRLKLDLDSIPDDLKALFPERVDDVRLEIGFGGGEHLIAEASRQPHIGFIGVEPFINGMAKALARIAALNLRNVRLYDNDAIALLERLPSASLTRIDLLYADPWPKKRQWKRRFVNAHTLSRFARILKPGGEFRFASDIESYVAWTLEYTAACPDFSSPQVSAEPWPHWPGTRYEAKALREGRTPAYLSFRRLTCA